MPLFSVKTRVKTSTARESPATTRKPDESGSLTVVLAGALFGLMLLAGLSAFLVVRARQAGVSGAPLPAGQASPPPGGALAIDSTVGPSTVNPEFNLQDIIAVVGSQPIHMRALDRSVRVARVLGALSGDSVPAQGDPALRQFQVQMLKRLVDVELMRQAAVAQGLIIPGGPVDDAVQGYLDQTASDRATLEAIMAREGVVIEEIERWFTDARTANWFVLNSLLVGRETESRDTVSQEWLAREWQAREDEIQISFYEPAP